MEVEDLFIYNIIPYINDNEFIETCSILCKNENIKKRRKEINKIKSANQLQECLKHYWLELQMYSNMLDKELYTWCVIDIKNLLFRKDSIYINSINLFKRPRMFYKKYICSNIIIDYTISGKRILSFENICINNVYICSVYRVCSIKKIILKDYLNVRALIY